MVLKIARSVHEPFWAQIMDDIVAGFTPTGTHHLCKHLFPNSIVFIFNFIFIPHQCCLGSSIRADRACNRYILVLERDSKLYNEVLKSMEALLPKPKDAILLTPN